MVKTRLSAHSRMIPLRAGPGVSKCWNCSGRTSGFSNLTKSVSRTSGTTSGVWTGVSSMLLSAQLLLDQLAHSSAVHGLPGQFRFGSSHYFAHIFQRRGGRFLHGFPDCFPNVVVRCRGRKILLDNFDFAFFLLCEFFAAAFSELVDRVFPLLDEGVENRKHFGFFERLHLLDLFILNGG